MNRYDDRIISVQELAQIRHALQLALNEIWTPGYGKRRTVDIPTIIQEVLAMPLLGGSI